MFKYLEHENAFTNTIQPIKIESEVHKIKSEMNVGNLTIMNTKHFNWFHKLMFKICFGIDIKDR